MHSEINYADPKGKKEKQLSRIGPKLASVSRSRDLPRRHGLLMCRFGAPLAVIHASAMEEKHLF